MSEWISVDDRLPEVGVTVIVEGGCGYYSDNVWWTLMGDNAHKLIQWKVTHWMPLPAPPEDKE